MGRLVLVLVVVLFCDSCCSSISSNQSSSSSSIHGLSPQRLQAIHRRYQKIWNSERTAASAGLGSMYLPSAPNSPCSEALDKVTNNNETLATLVDAWGKIPDGYLYGNGYAWGQYDQCINLRDDSIDIKGKYCLVSYRVKRTTAQDQALPLQWVEIDVPSLVDVPGINLQYGTCMPHQCTQQQLNDSLVAALNETDKYLYSLHCYDTDGTLNLDGVDIGFIVFCVVIWTLMLGGAIAEEYIRRTKQESLKNGPLRFVIPFSVTTNIEKLFKINPNPKGSITCLYGMRFLSMCWVVHGHQHIFGTKINSAGVNDLSDGFLFQIIWYANVVTDTFFFMGGMLVTYGLFRELERTGKFNFIMYYVHRLIRLSPTIAVVSWYFASMNSHFINGPTSNSVDRTRDGCRDYWWKDTFHVTNVGESKYNMCNGQAWYTSVDTQIYLVAPLMILPLYYFKKTGAGRMWLYLLTLVSLIIPAALTYDYDLAPGHYSNSKDGDYSRLIYRMPWSRSSAWIVGIWTGYLLNQMSHKKLILKKWMVVCGWTVCFLTLFLVQFGLYSYAQYVPLAQYDIMTAVVYGGLHRFAWSACLAWIVIACTAGYGGVIHEFLSNSGWQPLQRLTFPMYLLGFNFQLTMMKNFRVPAYFGHTAKIIESCGLLFLIGIGAIFITLMVEVPILNLEKIILKRPGRSNQEGKKNIDKQGQDNPLTVKDTEITNNESKDEEQGDVTKHLPPNYVPAIGVSNTSMEKESNEESVIEMNGISK